MRRGGGIFVVARKRCRPSNPTVTIARTARAIQASSPAPSPNYRGVWLGLAVFAAMLLTYLPALNGGFIWNDSEYVTTPALRSIEGLGRIWFELGATEQYYPLLHTAFRLDSNRGPRAYALATVLFIAALLTKSVTATLPAALLVVFWWRRGRLEWRRDVLPLLPWFAVGAAMGLVSAHVERVYIGAEGDEFALTLLQRCLLAGRIAWFYAGKLVWPAELIFIYPRWNVDPANLAHWLFSLAVLALLAGLWRLRGRSRAPLAAALFFGGSLFPTLGWSTTI